MGFFDCRCMITGVSLKGAEAALVPLLRVDTGYLPFALAIKGSYNRLGSIDYIEEDANTAMVLEFFLRQLQSGNFVLSPACLRHSNSYPLVSIEKLLNGFERNINDDPKAATLAGKPIVFALVSRMVWDTLAQLEPAAAADAAAAAGERSFVEAFGQLFADAALVAEVYGGDWQKVAEALGELAAVSQFLASRKIAWQVAEAGGQDSTAVMQYCLEEARRVFSDSPVILEGLAAYEIEVGDLLEGFDD